jgi:hypothetical protein
MVRDEKYPLEPLRSKVLNRDRQSLQHVQKPLGVQLCRGHHLDPYTSSFLSRAKVPIVAESDQQAVDIALRSSGAVAQGQERVMRIRDTLHLEEIYVSE